MNDVTQNGIIETVFPMAFAPTVDRLEQAIATAGLTLFAKIDHAAGAREAGMVMPPATVLIYGHPEGGTPIMLAAPLTALDLPLRVLIRQREDGQVAVCFHPVGPWLRGARVPDDLIVRIEPAQRLVQQALTP